MKLLVTSRLPSPWGTYSISAFGQEGERFPHVVLHRGVKEALASNEPVDVRVHSECMTGDVFASQRCDCDSRTWARFFNSLSAIVYPKRAAAKMVALVPLPFPSPPPQGAG